MRVLEYENIPELEGKTIAFTHIAQFADNVTIATEDGCVIVITQDLDEDYGETKRTKVLPKPYAVQYIEGSKYLREELSKRGIFDIEAYKKKQRELAEKRKEEFRMAQEKKEREEYERLKAKFSDK
ncbi:hypothetical protein MKZ02_20060 [Pseudobacillus sp. FSL P4-0506]|uniref:hypothetical protein n=1 Tax=Pseudobacillus sp. FSL P4-0506 TaxID=2921576 RepID=UPI0030FB1827